MHSSVVFVYSAKRSSESESALHLRVSAPDRFTGSVPESAAVEDSPIKLMERK